MLEQQGKHAVGEEKHNGYELKADMLSNENYLCRMETATRKKQNARRRSLLGFCCGFGTAE
jgi:hypothetical protein